MTLFGYVRHLIYFCAFSNSVPDSVTIPPFSHVYHVCSELRWHEVIPTGWMERGVDSLHPDRPKLSWDFAVRTTVPYLDFYTHHWRRPPVNYITDAFLPCPRDEVLTSFTGTWWHFTFFIFLLIGTRVEDSAASFTSELLASSAHLSQREQGVAHCHLRPPTLLSCTCPSHKSLLLFCEADLTLGYMPLSFKDNAPEPVRSPGRADLTVNVDSAYLASAMTGTARAPL